MLHNDVAIFDLHFTRIKNSGENVRENSYNNNINETNDGNENWSKGNVMCVCDT